MDIAELFDGMLVRHRVHPEWGIGSVEEIDRGNAVTRFYGREELVCRCAPADLLRHRYAVNDQIFAITENAFGFVQSVREFDGEITYQVLFGNRRKGIPESNIRPQLFVPDLFDLLRESDGSESRHFLLALQARRLKYAYQYDELVCLSNARIELLPHQVFVADRVLRDFPHRVLLADEVGLGKTIEAGLILKELRARGAARRVLVIAPSGLVSQWVNELRSKFNEIFTRIDSTNFGAHLALCGGDAEQVWRSHSSIVTSLHMLRGNERHIEALLSQEWDLVIFDEAHHLRRYRDPRWRNSSEAPDQHRVTSAYRLAERLQQRTTSLLLLTATPLQLHAYELFSLIELIDSTLFPSYPDFEQFTTRVPRLNNAALRLERCEDLDEQAQYALAKDISALTAGEGPRLHIPQILEQFGLPAGRAALQQRLLDAHRLSRAMIRNRKRQVFDDLQPRRARILRVAYTEAEWAAYHAVTAYLQEWYNVALQQQNNALGFLMVTYRKILTSSSFAMRQSFLRRIDRLRHIQRGGRLLDENDAGIIDEGDAEELDDLLERYGDAITRADPALVDLEVDQLRHLVSMLEQITIDAKAEGLMAELAQTLSDPAEKILIFTQFTETLRYLRGLLAPLYDVCVFSGEMSAYEKDQAVDDFRERCQIMIATEAAGEGRNLQFCHRMVNYDLPWNPMRIEQRIGRLDRIGQRAPVQIVNLSITDTLEDRVLQVLQERIHLFESVVGALDPILERIEGDVRQYMFEDNGDLETRTREFEERVTRRAQQVAQMEEQLADLLLDTGSFRRDRADALLGRTPPFSGEDLHRFLSQYLAFAGGQVRERAVDIYDLVVPPAMSVGMREGLRDSYRATFSAEVAQRQERLDFVAFGHPVLDRAVELCLEDHFGGRTAHLILHTDALPPQRAIVAIYTLSFEGVRQRRQVRAFAAGLDGSPLPELSEQALALLVSASPASFSAVEAAAFVAAVEYARSTLEDAAALARSREQQAQEADNRREYERTTAKLRRYYEANILSRTRELEQLERRAAEQQQSPDPNVRRVAPATLGRAAAARRELQGLEAERDYRLSQLTRRRTVAASEELLALAFVTIAPTA